MELTGFKTNLSNISNQIYIRLDSRNRRLKDTNISIWGKSVKVVTLGNIIEELPITKLKKGPLAEEYDLLNISDQIQNSGRIDCLETVEEIGSDKNLLSGADIVISKLGLPKGYLYLIPRESDKKIIGSSELIPYRIKGEYSKLVLKYVLLNSKMKNVYLMLETGKTPSHKRVNPKELLSTEIPVIPMAKQLELESIITEKENIIESVIEKKKDKLEIINEVFAEEFGYPTTFWKDYGISMSVGTQKSKIRETKSFKLDVNQISLQDQFRMSTRYHNPFAEKLNYVLNSIGTIFLKEILYEDVVRGVQPKPDENGEVSVIKTAQLKNGFIDMSEADLVTEKFYNTKKRAQIQYGDILIASTGKGSIGKVDLYSDNEAAMVDGHISIIRIDEEKYDKQFLVYYLRSILGTYQIEREYTGATNQVELYPEEIENIKLLNISIEKQEAIASKIKLQLEEQNSIVSELNRHINEIHNLVEKEFEITP